MSQSIQKREAGLLDGKPDKRLFWSIISDYDLRTALCELIDNAIDIWIRTKAPRPDLSIELSLDAERQLITIKDNAGGVGHENLRLLIAPGASNNEPEGETIGFFGVGSKRAVIALAETVCIKTRFRDQQSFQIDVTKDWIESDVWDIPHFEIPEIPEGVTILELSSLRKSFNDSDVERLRSHIGETYEWFLQIDNCKINLNGQNVTPLSFDTWAYPPGHEPRRSAFDIQLKDQKTISAEIIVGLITDRDPAADNYGAYFYCNNRLIIKELKSREVGYFITSEAGVPHPDASLCRAIVRLNGSARVMPWSSNKSSINFNHLTFQALRPRLVQLLSHFSSLSRRLKDDWNDKVFRHKSGEIVDVEQGSVDVGKRILLPELPKVRKAFSETLKSKNKATLLDQPWTLGLVEAIAAVDIIGSKTLETKNRIALILLDSNFEIGLKEFIVHRNDLFPPKQYDNAAISKLFQNRRNVIREVTAKINIPQKLLDKAQHYYELRNKFIHERATAEITDKDVAVYQDTVQKVLKILFDLDFE